MDGNTEISFISLSLKIFFVFNAIGQIPLFVALLAPYEHARQKKIIIRELLIALFILLLFVFAGPQILAILDINKHVISLSGGLLLLLISLTLIFPKEGETKGLPEHEPLIVPLAMPGLAGPGSMAMVMVFAEQQGYLLTAAAVVGAWIPSLILIYFASYIKNYLGEKGLLAVQRLGGMLISLIGVKMLTQGIIDFVKNSF